MSTPPDTTPVERAEGLLGLGEPKPRSWFWVAYLGSLAALSLGFIVWPFASGGGRPLDAGFLVWGSLFVSLWALADTGGSLMHVRRGAPWGRGLRAFGYAVFLPLAMGLWLAHFWFSANTFFFVVAALLVGSVMVQWAVRVARRA